LSLEFLIEKDGGEKFILEQSQQQAEGKACEFSICLNLKELESLEFETKLYSRD
jgi:hypothetical protein